MTDFFDPVEPSKDDARAFALGLFPTVLLGNHIQWAINYLGLDESVKRTAQDCWPRWRLYLQEACKQVCLAESKEKKDD